MGDRLSAEERKRKGWRKALEEGYVPALRLRRFFRMWPSAPRCGMCMAPFKGIGSIVFKPLPFTSPSRKNPNWCRICFEDAPIGGAEVPTGVLFADMRGYTSYAEARSPADVAQLLNRFYSIATEVFARHDAVIDKLVGDEVMALWLPGFAGREEYIQKMISGAESLLRAVGYGEDRKVWLPLGLGLDTGRAYVGNVGIGPVKDFTALGDVVNTAARLQSEAKPGQMVMSERVYEFAGDRYPSALSVELELKGKTEPVAARIIDLSASAA